MAKKKPKKPKKPSTPKKAAKPAPKKAPVPPAPKKPKPTGSPESLSYVSAQYPIRELYTSLLVRTKALAHAGYECFWTTIEISDVKSLLLPHHVSRVNEHTLWCWPLLVSEKKTGNVPALQLGLEIDTLENVAMLKGTGRIARDENRYEVVYEILSQFRALTGIQLAVEAKG